MQNTNEPFSFSEQPTKDNSYFRHWAAENENFIKVEINQKPSSDLHSFRELRQNLIRINAWLEYNFGKKYCPNENRRGVWHQMPSSNVFSMLEDQFVIFKLKWG